MSCSSELRDKHPAAQVQNWLHVAKFHHQIFIRGRSVVLEAEFALRAFLRISDWFLLPPIMVWAAKTPITRQRLSVYSFIYPSLQLKDILRLCSSCCISVIE